MIECPYCGPDGTIHNGESTKICPHCNGSHFVDPDFEDESEGFDSCQNCNKAFDEIDHEYQICSYCGFDSERAVFTNTKLREQPDLF